MIWSLLFAAAFGVTAVWILVKAKRTTVRRVALAPLAACAVELLVCGVLATGVSPVLTVLLFAARAAIFGCCVSAMKQDAAAEKARARRRANYLRAMENLRLPPLRLVPRRRVDAQAASRVADIA